MITKKQFAEEFAELADEAGIDETCAIEFTDEVRTSPRSYADVDPHNLHFRFAPETLELSWEHRRGLLMHEIGHVLCRDMKDGGTEDDADRAAFQCFGERIVYDKRWPGKGLQCVRSGQRNPAEDFSTLVRSIMLDHIHKYGSGGLTVDAATDVVTTHAPRYGSSGWRELPSHETKYITQMALQDMARDGEVDIRYDVVGPYEREVTVFSAKRLSRKKNPSDLLPMVHSYLREDRQGRLDYINNMNLAALAQVMELEDDEDLWIAAAEAKKRILRG